MKTIRYFSLLATLCLFALILVTGANAAPLSEVQEFTTGLTPETGPNDVVSGPDGNLWLTETYTGRIARINPTDGSYTEFSEGMASGSHPWAITAGPDGNLWFTDEQRIGRITTDGVITEFPVGADQNFGAHITTGPDGNLWFTEPESNRIGRITTSGAVTEFSQGISAGAKPQDITTGPDGNLWFTEYGIGKIGRITPAGEITEFPVEGSPTSHPTGITAGPDGNLWFTDPDNGGFVGRISTDGAVTKFSAPGRPVEITTGPDGNLWFTDFLNGAVDRVTTAGVITSFSTGTQANATLQAITTGPDGNLWFTGFFNNNIGWIGTGISSASEAPPVVLRERALSRENKCSGEKWSNWAGWLPGGTAVSWSRDGVKIPGATDRTYRASSADAGRKLSCTVRVRYPFALTYAAATSTRVEVRKQTWLIECKRQRHRRTRTFRCTSRVASATTRLRGKVSSATLVRRHQRYRVRVALRGNRVELLSTRELRRGTYRMRRGHRSYRLSVNAPARPLH